MENKLQTVGSLYNDLVQQFPGREKLVKAILKDYAPKVVPGYHHYTRPDPSYDAERQNMGLPPVVRMGPELATLTPDQYSQLRAQVVQHFNKL